MAVFQGGLSDNGALTIRPLVSLTRDLPEVKAKMDRSRFPNHQGFIA
jgi:hypothetical protein